MARTWDADGTQLAQNLQQASRDVLDDAARRERVSRELARHWHIACMNDLAVPPPFDDSDIGRFRCEPGAEDCELMIGDESGRMIHALPAPSKVGAMLDTFEQWLNLELDDLDQRYPAGSKLDAAGITSVIEVAARAHNHWIRIHPFANGNGRTARMWANYVFARYKLRPPFRLRPRPENGYDEAASAAMARNDLPMRKFIGDEFVRQAMTDFYKS